MIWTASSLADGKEPQTTTIYKAKDFIGRRDQKQGRFTRGGKKSRGLLQGYSPLGDGGGFQAECLTLTWRLVIGLFNTLCMGELKL